MTPEQQEQIEDATRRAFSMKEKGHTLSEVRFGLRQDGYHPVPRRVALKRAFPIEETMQKLADLGQEWEQAE